MGLKFYDFKNYYNTVFTVEPEETLQNKKQEMEELKEKDYQTLFGIETKLIGDVADKVESACKKGVPFEIVRVCRDPVDYFWTWHYVGTYISHCMSCHDKAIERLDTEAAKTCCLEDIATMKKQATSDRIKAFACVIRRSREFKAGARRGARKALNNQVQRLS